MEEKVLYVATGNLGKLLDFATAATAVGGGWRLEPLPGLEQMAAPEETGATFAANAEAKALYYGAQVPDCWVMADDSGLEVDALEGAPGVYSARYAERLGLMRPPGGATRVSADGLNNASLLMQLAGREARVETTEENRGARYRCVLAVARGGQVVARAEGSVEGVILLAPRGLGGFGYDPLFWLPERGCTMAELSPEERLGVSHRGEALRRLLGGWRG